MEEIDICQLPVGTRGYRRIGSSCVVSGELGDNLSWLVDLTSVIVSPIDSCMESISQDEEQNESPFSA